MKIQKILGRVILAAVALYIVWLGWQIVSFKRYESTLIPSGRDAATKANATAPLPGAPPVSTAPTQPPSGTAPAPQALSNHQPSPPPQPVLYEIEGAYHMHSRHSDGRKTVDEIAKIAAAAKLDFIIFTDHGKPNFASLDAQGRKNGVLVIAGSELSTNRGHLVALAFERPAPSRIFSQNAETAAAEIRALGGMTVIAHPYSKTRWSWGTENDYSGLEIMDADSMVKRNLLGHLPYFPALLIKPTFALLKMIDPPTAALRKWDQLLSRRPNPPTFGFFSSDAHFFYSGIFPIFHLHLLLTAPPSPDFEAARAQIFDALRRGSFYSAVDGAASARGFRIWREGQALRLAAPFSFAHETVIIHDGRPIHRSAETEIAFRLQGPGVYRAEVYLRERSPLAADVPWIAASPIVIEKDDK